MISLWRRDIARMLFLRGCCVESEKSCSCHGRRDACKCEVASRVAECEQKWIASFGLPSCELEEPAEPVDEHDLDRPEQCGRAVQLSRGFALYVESNHA